jgi:UDP-N-acetylmuramate-alanine ligase
MWQSGLVRPPDPSRALSLARAALGRERSPFHELPRRLLVVDVEQQELFIIEDGTVGEGLQVSTAAAGLGGEAGSLRTPPGWHRIHRKIGGDQPSGAVFESRAPTGVVWKGEPVDADLILTRVLTLEGLEDGVNRGPGRDSLERFIYLHGTNHEDRLGEPVSHGCVRLANADVAWLFDQVEEGDPVLVTGEEARPSFPDPMAAGRFHYAGIGGSGMSALAQFQAMASGEVSGSDRAFDRGERAEHRRELERLGITIYPQDGSGIPGAAAVVLSSAVESEVPDFASARAQGVATVHRSELLAHFVSACRTAAIAGTSGKSSVVAMVFEILRHSGSRPSVISGGELLLLQAEGMIGNAFNDPQSDVLVVEADESDGSLVHYRPTVGVVLNLQKDHKEMHEVAMLFERFVARAREAFVTGEDENLAALARHAAQVFGFGPRATVRAQALELLPDRSRFAVDGAVFELPVPGRHNVENALAAIATCRTLGVPIEAMAKPLAGFHGVARRFQSLGKARGVEVVDDFAHNPAKLRAAIETAKTRARRVLAVYQPHGYGPTRFLRPDLVEAFAQSLRSEDRLWMLEVFYAGGKAARDFSAADIVAEVAARGVRAGFSDSREALAATLALEARAGDLVLVMGARDPSLTRFAQEVLGALDAATARVGEYPSSSQP